MDDMRRLKPKLKERYELWKAESVEGLPSSGLGDPGSLNLLPSSTSYIQYAPSPSNVSTAQARKASQPSSASIFHTPFIPYTPAPTVVSEYRTSQPIAYPNIPNATTSRPVQRPLTGALGGFAVPLADNNSARIETVPNKPADVLPPTTSMLLRDAHSNSLRFLSASFTEGGLPLRNIDLPACIMETFAAVALRNTNK